MNELHLHVGFPKCASSSIQLFCLENAARLKEFGFDYPEVFTRRNGNATPLAMSLMDEMPEFYARRANDYTDVFEFDSLMREQYLIHRNENTKLLLSSEGFLKFGPELIKEKFSDYFDKIHIYIVVRPQVAWVESHYTQVTHTGRYKGRPKDFLDQVLDKQVLYIALYLDRLYKDWVKVFGKQQVHFLYISRKAPPIEEQFLEALGIEIDDSFHRLDRKINSAIVPAFLPIILRLPPCAYVYHLDLVIGLTKIWAEHAVELKGSLFSHEERISIQKKYAEANHQFSAMNPHIPREELCDAREEVPYLPFDQMTELKELQPFYQKAEVLLAEISALSTANDGKEVFTEPPAR